MRSYFCSECACEILINSIVSMTEFHCLDCGKTTKHYSAYEASGPWRKALLRDKKAEDSLRKGAHLVTVGLMCIRDSILDVIEDHLTGEDRINIRMKILALFRDHGA